MQVAVLSPHCDDAAFSCGLLLTRLGAAGISSSIINVCTVSDYAPYLEVRQDDRVSHVTAVRAKEDESFAQTISSLAAKVHFGDLGWKDAPLRLLLEGDEVLTQSAPSTAEVSSLASTLQAQLDQCDAERLVFAPLGIGNHIDHLTVREAATSVCGEANLIYYQDLPYACRIPSEQRAAERAKLKQYGEIWIPPWQVAQGTKRNHALCYPSQISPDVADEMENYAQELGGRELFFGKPAAFSNLMRVVEQRGVLA